MPSWGLCAYNLLTPQKLARERRAAPLNLCIRVPMGVCCWHLCSVDLGTSLGSCMSWSPAWSSGRVAALLGSSREDPYLRYPQPFSPTAYVSAEQQLCVQIQELQPGKANSSHPHGTDTPIMSSSDVPCVDKHMVFKAPWFQD